MNKEFKKKKHSSVYKGLKIPSEAGASVSANVSCAGTGAGVCEASAALHAYKKIRSR